MSPTITVTTPPPAPATLPPLPGPGDVDLEWVPVTKEEEPMGPEAQSRGVMFIDSHGTAVPLIFISEYGLNSQAMTDKLWLRQRQLQEQLRQGSLDPRKPPKPWAGNIAKQKRNQKNYTKH